MYLHCYTSVSPKQTVNRTTFICKFLKLQVDYISDKDDNLGHKKEKKRV